MSGETWIPSPGLLEDLAIVLKNADELTPTWFDADERTVVGLVEEPEDLEPPAEDAPAWRVEEYALAKRILENPDRYHRLYSTGTPGRLHDFIRTVEDEALQEELWNAARGGRGAYRRVRDVLHRLGLQQLWYDHEAAADQELALSWLRSEGLL